VHIVLGEKAVKPQAAKLEAETRSAG